MLSTPTVHGLYQHHRDLMTLRQQHKALQRMHARLRVWSSKCGTLQRSSGTVSLPGCSTHAALRLVVAPAVPIFVISNMFGSSMLTAGRQRVEDMAYLRRVAHRKRFCKDTISLAVLCLDRWCGVVKPAGAAPQPHDLVAFVSLVVSSKVHEPEEFQVRLRDVVLECGRRYTVKQAAALELEMLDQLGWRINLPTPNELCRHLVAAVGLEYEEEREDTCCLQEPDWHDLLHIAEDIIECSHPSPAAPACCPATTAYAAALAASQCQAAGRWTPAAQDVMLRLAQENGLDLPQVNTSAQHFQILYREHQRRLAAKRKLRESPDCVADFEQACGGSDRESSTAAEHGGNSLDQQPPAVSAASILHSPPLPFHIIEVCKPTALKPVPSKAIAFPLWNGCTKAPAPMPAALQLSAASCFKRARPNPVLLEAL